ncbi:SDR family NAD(P)-dependent oxidoreductase, partial [Kitasatospora sp. NPDC018058]|uniref:SDR family NAD(P)-dependent oxidoreductase n=1 Tax=Kitasatospora sp. NPDC018058 TaxID=3364025 RepID=UPI0037BF9E7E
HTHGHPTTRPTPPTTHLDLPTYPFQHQRYWLHSDPSSSSPDADGLNHPLLRMTVALPDTGGTLFTGRLSVDAQPWLADHAVLGTVLLPGTGLVELVLQGAARVGCDTLEELVLEAPLVLPEHGAMSVQVALGAPEESGTRTVAVYSRPEKSPADLPWTRHAAGTVTPAGAEPAFSPTEWPPPGALPVDLTDAYQRLLVRGYHYGPVFQGLRAAWRRGDEVFAEVALPEETTPEAAAFGVHPALLDASLHAFVLDLHEDRSDAEDAVPPTRLPFAWHGARVHAPGAAAVRVRLRPVAADAVSVDVADLEGTPVASVESLVVRPVSTEQLRTAANALGAADTWRYHVAWEAAPDPAALGTLSGTWLAVGSPVPVDSPVADLLAALEAAGAGLVRLDVPAGTTRDALASRLSDLAVPLAGVVSCLPLAEGDHPEFAGLTTGLTDSLALVQALGDANVQAPLWCLTRGAVAVDDTEEVTSPEQAMLWGLGRVAALEHPDRWGGLIDLPAEPGEHDGARLTGILATTGGPEDQLALRTSGVFRRRLAPTEGPTRAATEPSTGAAPEGWAPRDSVLITGGTGGLGVQVARWAARHGAPEVVLLSRRGPAAEAVNALRAELAPLGTRVRAVAADVADRASLAAALGGLRADGCVVGTVVHAAGIVDDCPVADLRPADLARVSAVKTVGARLLQELLETGEAGEVRQKPLEAFVVFSSIAGVWGSGRQAAYAAANAYLDAFVQQRRSRGLAGTALAWGPWAGGGMVDATYEHQLRRRGLTPMDPEAAVHHLGRSLAADDTATVIADVDWTAFHPSFTALSPSPLFDAVPQVQRAQRVRRAAAPSATAGGGTLAAQLARTTPEEQERLLLQAIRTQIAAVLALDSREAVAPDRALGEIGFDSLMAVDLRNRLNTATGTRLPATLVFDHPTPLALARYLRSVVVPDRVDPAALAAEEFDRLETAVLALAPDTAARSVLAMRLGALTAKLEDFERTADADAEGVEKSLETATAEELMQLIDTEFGDV